MQHEPVNVDRLRACTGWQPTTTVEEGVRSTLEFSSDG
jgi:nucleoside-diphosphate-sugar epimerase